MQRIFVIRIVCNWPKGWADDDLPGTFSICYFCHTMTFMIDSGWWFWRDIFKTTDYFRRQDTFCWQKRQKCGQWEFILYLWVICWCSYFLVILTLDFLLTEWNFQMASIGIRTIWLIIQMLGAWHSILLIVICSIANIINWLLMLCLEHRTRELFLFLCTLLIFYQLNSWVRFFLVSIIQANAMRNFERYH